MCGIYGVVNDGSDEVALHVLEGLKKLEYRGYDSWGIALVTPAGIKVEKHVGKIGEATTSLPPGTTALGHTRWATHGGVTDKNAHPHLDCEKRIAVIHNGIVENYQELKEELIQKKHIFRSETDTEVVAHLIEEELKKHDFAESVRLVFKKLVGSNAIGAIDSKTGTIVACRDGSPLVVGLGKTSSYLASDVTPFLHETNRVHFLDDGEGIYLSEQKVTLFDIKTGREKKLTVDTVNWKTEDAEKGGYPHFLLKEIMEQKKTISKTASINSDVIQKVAEKIASGAKVMMTACGTAFYTTLAAKYFFAHVGITTDPIGAYEFAPFARGCDKNTVLIAVSQSGETADTLIAVREAKKRGAQIVAVVNARNSTLERLADFVLPVSAGPEIAVVSTKAFTSQLATLYLLAMATGGKYKEASSFVKNMESVLDTWLTKKILDSVTDLAHRLIDEEDMYVIGKYLGYPAALEFALKLKESSYIHAEAFASGELKHGVIALIQKGSPCFVVGQNDGSEREILSSAAELKARGGMIIGISPFEAREYDVHIKTPDFGELTIIGNVIVGQLLGYYLGIGRGADPDKPRNLAKSVTVK